MKPVSAIINGCDFSICHACFSKHAAKDIDSSADSSAASSSKGDLLTMAVDEPVALTIETPAAPSRSDAGEAKESKAPSNPEQPSVDTERPLDASHRHAQQSVIGSQVERTSTASCICLHFPSIIKHWYNTAKGHKGNPSSNGISHIRYKTYLYACHIGG